MAMMELLLKENVDNLGIRGDIVKVRPGYGRNYLIPQGLAMAATPANVKMIERERRLLLQKAAEEKAAAETLGGALNGLELAFVRRAGEQGTLYGSVTAIDIAEALAAQGREVERRRILLKEPIKTTGEFSVPVKLHRDVSVSVKVVVAPEEDAAAS
jgi:large subunit ribosomal protein L9